MNKTFYTFEELKNGSFAKAESETSLKFAVLGYPIAHSLSPYMHNKLFEEYSIKSPIFKCAKYFAFEVKPENFPEALTLLKKENFQGINLTIPHKEQAYLLANYRSSSAKLSKTANTLIKKNDNFSAYNTDGYGLLKTITNELKVNYLKSKVIIIGAGGAAKGTSFYLAKEGVNEIFITNRTLEKAQKLTDELNSAGFNAKTFDLNTSEKSFYENSIIINATSLGLKKSDPAVLDFSKIPQSAVFLDMTYSKAFDSNSIIDANANKILSQNGLAMLAYQGEKVQELFTGKKSKGTKLLNILKDFCNEYRANK